MRRNIVKIFILIIILTFVLSIGNAFFDIKDLYTVLSLTLSTVLLLVISDYKKADFNQIVTRVRANLFLVAIMMSFIKIYSSVAYSVTEKTQMNSIAEGLKPLAISLYMYIIFINVITRFESDKQKLNENENELNHELNQEENINSLNLTRREKEIFNLILEGCTNKEISEKLFIEETTVKKHIQNILKKLDLANRTEIIDKYKGASDNC